MQGYLSTNYSDNYFFLSQRHPEVPRLTPAQLEAMKLFNQLAASDALRLEANLEPGDIQLLNNHTQVCAGVAEQPALSGQSPMLITSGDRCLHGVQSCHQRVLLLM